ncbi:winged helix-turn-helix domain-containing protein [Streptomyces sp. NPDC001185]|uniref:helix-turn-helix domain-containing protein n=1 Tax=Streptomyces sp. NPDC001185 TaxID=3154380 RepID=UPI00332A4DA5
MSAGLEGPGIGCAVRRRTVRFDGAGTGQRAGALGRLNQTWTLSRLRTLSGRRFHTSHIAQGVAVLLKRHGWTCRVPARGAIERDETAVAGCVMATWPRVEGSWQRSTHGPSLSTRPDSR